MMNLNTSRIYIIILQICNSQKTLILRNQQSIQKNLRPRLETGPIVYFTSKNNSRMKMIADNKYIKTSVKNIEYKNKSILMTHLL